MAYERYTKLGLQIIWVNKRKHVQLLSNVIELLLYCVAILIQYSTIENQLMLADQVTKEFHGPIIPL